MAFNPFENNPIWLQRAIKTYRFHADQMQKDAAWRVANTAKALKRSIGGVSEDLLIASWMKTHGDKIKSCQYAYEALMFIRDKKKTLALDLTHLD